MPKYKQVKRCRARNCERILGTNNRSGFCNRHINDYNEMKKRLASPTYPEIKKSIIRKELNENIIQRNCLG